MLQATQPGYTILDIGCSYGVYALPLLQKGAYVVANDVDAFSLYTLVLGAQEKELAKLTLSYGRFPEEVNAPESYFDGIQMCHVLHYMTPDQIQTSLTKIYRILKPGGKIYLTTLTPYCGNFPNSFGKEAKQRLKDGTLWPGEIQKRSLMWQKSTSSTLDKDPFPGLPDYMHPQFPDILQREASYAGFQHLDFGYCPLSEAEQELLNSNTLISNSKAPKPNKYIGKSAAYLIGQKPY